MTTGLSFPIQVVPGTGTLRLSSGQERIKEQILEILTTDFLERVLRPEFGSEPFLFQSVSNPTVLASRIQFSLRRYLSINIEINVTARFEATGKVDLNIAYFDNSTTAQGNVRTELTF